MYVLVDRFELFQMKISEIITRFTGITKSL